MKPKNLFRKLHGKWLFWKYRKGTVRQREIQQDLFYNMDEYGHVEEYVPVTIKRVLPWDWWLYPVFDFGLKYPMPYIWFAYWLITWEEDSLWALDFTTVRIFGWAKIPVRAFRFIRISISFLPD